MTYAVSTTPFESIPADGPQFAGSRQLFRDGALEFGVKLSAEEHNDWRGILGCAAIVDHLVDVERAGLMPHIHAILAGRERDDLGERVQTDFREYMYKQSADRSEAILDDLRRVEELAAAQRKATKAQDVVDIRLTEAAILARLLALTVGNGYDALPRQRFNEWLFYWSRAGYLVDSFFDLKADYQNGESGVKPTIGATGILARAAVRESLAALRKTPPALVGKCAVNGFKYVVLGIKLPATAEQPTG